VYHGFHKVDQNHSDIVEVFRSYPGVSVFSIAAVGDGVPDLVVGMDGWTILVEVKVGRKKLNALQVSWHDSWQGTPVVIIRSPGDVHSLVRNTRMARRVFGDPSPRAEDTSA